MKRSVENYFEKGYRPGSIVRVKMINFITYDDAEVFPGPRLNVVLGPNGTGKSTLTHAICLACAGKVSTVGRSGDLKQFVKIGKENSKEGAYVEIDILKQKEIVTIRRELSGDDNSSKWTMNSRNSTKAAVKALMTELSIDVDNLCSFMAQDKVGNFTLQSPREILQTTLKSIRDNQENKTLNEIQLELVSVESAKLQRLRELDGITQQASNLQQQLNVMRPEVERMTKRKEIEKKLELCRMKKIVIASKESKENKQKYQDAVDEANKNVEDEKRKSQPLKTQERELEKSKMLEDKKTESFRVSRKSSEEKLRKAKEELEESDVFTTASEAELNRLDQKRKLVEQKVGNLRKEIEELEEKHNRAQASVPKIEEAIKEFSVIISQKNEMSLKLDDEIQELDGQHKKATQNRSRKEIELNNLKDPRIMFEKKLEFPYTDIKKVMDYLSVPDNKRQFRKEVYGPLALLIKTKDPAIATIIEKITSSRHLHSYVVECEEDERTLKSVARNLNAKLDVYTINHIERKQGKFRPDELQRAKSFGIQGYLSDQIELPDAVRCFFNSFKELNNVLWASGKDIGNKLTSEQLNSLLEGRGSYSLYAVNVNPSKKGGYEYIDEFSGGRGRTGNTYQTKSQIKDAKVLEVDSASGDIDSIRDNLKQELLTIRSDISTIESNLRLKNQERTKIGQEISEFKEKKRRAHESLKQPNLYAQSLKGKRESLSEGLKTLSVDANKEKDKLQQNLFDAIQKQLSLFKKVQAQCQDVNEKYLEATIAENKGRAIAIELTEIKNRIREYDEGIKGLVAILKAKTEERDRAQRDFSKAEEDLKNLEAEVGGKSALQEKYREIINVCPESTLIEINLRIETLMMEIESAVDNPQVLLRYSAAERELAECLEQKEALQSSYNKIEDSMTARLNRWMNSVHAVVNKLSASFSEYMSALQYKGEVMLRDTGTIDQYEIVMRVSFRYDSPLSDLSGEKHSGGERAVSTIMYLMAMQELTSSPFRVVDEINQGMDERNERLVFDRIVQSCCLGNEKPQYFLVSPKLLQGLRAIAHEHVTALMVWNGSGVLKKWQLPQVIKSLKRKRDSLLNEKENEH